MFANTRVNSDATFFRVCVIHADVDRGIRWNTRVVGSFVCRDDAL